MTPPPLTVEEAARFLAAAIQRQPFGSLPPAVDAAAGRLLDALSARRVSERWRPGVLRAGDRITDGGVTGALVRCQLCGGGGLLLREDEPARDDEAASAA